MITLYHQSGIVGGKWIPNSVPHNYRDSNSYNDGNYKSVKTKFISEICEYLDLPFEQVSPETYKNNIAYYHIEVDWIDQAFVYRNVFEHIDDRTMELIKKGNLRLLLWFPNEGFSLQMPRFIDIIDFCIKDLEIPLDKVYLVFGDLNIKNNYKLYAKQKGYVDINVYGMDSFESTYCKEIEMLESAGSYCISQDEFLYHWKRPREKSFIFKNANPREQRIYFAAELKNRNLLDTAYYSWLNRYFIPDIENTSSLEKYCADKSKLPQLQKSLKEFFKNVPYIIDFNGHEIEQDLNQRILVNYHFLNSYFSFVTETTYEDSWEEDVLFITEKTYQPIVNYHPFITASQVDTLTYLKGNGYATFPELFDESYDNELDVKKRSDIILNSIQNFNKDIYFSDIIKDKLIHNRNLFFERKGKDSWIKCFKWLER
jgi:hypothetical protein